MEYYNLSWSELVRSGFPSVTLKTCNRLSKENPFQDASKDIRGNSARDLGGVERGKEHQDDHMFRIEADSISRGIMGYFLTN